MFFFLNFFIFLFFVFFLLLFLSFLVFLFSFFSSFLLRGRRRHGRHHQEASGIPLDTPSNPILMCRLSQSIIFPSGLAPISSSFLHVFTKFLSERFLASFPCVFRPSCIMYVPQVATASEGGHKHHTSALHQPVYVFLLTRTGRLPFPPSTPSPFIPRYPLSSPLCLPSSLPVCLQPLLLQSPRWLQEAALATLALQLTFSRAAAPTQISG